MTILVISGTGTEVGKTVTTAAIAALGLDDGRRVAVLKPAQTGVRAGEPGDVDEVRRLAGPVTTVELARYPDPLAPDTAARRAGLAPVRAVDVVDAALKLHTEHDLVLIEGAGGLLVRLNADGETIADVASAVQAPVLIVVAAGLGTLNATALTTEALQHRAIECAGIVIGSWPRNPDLAAQCNLEDLPTVAGVPLLGALPEGMSQSARFLETARASLNSAW